jgi:hypothetical protein
MAWRKVQKEDIKRGVVIRMTRMDGSYNMATVISEKYAKDQYPDSGIVSVTVCRPMCWAHEHFNSRNGMLSGETFDITVEALINPYGDYEVYQDRDQVGTMAT